MDVGQAVLWIGTAASLSAAETALLHDNGYDGEALLDAHSSDFGPDGLKLPMARVRKLLNAIENWRAQYSPTTMVSASSFYSEVLVIFTFAPLISQRPAL